MMMGRAFGKRLGLVNNWNIPVIGLVTHLRNSPMLTDCSPL